MVSDISSISLTTECSHLLRERLNEGSWEAIYSRLLDDPYQNLPALLLQRLVTFPPRHQITPCLLAKLLTVKKTAKRNGSGPTSTTHTLPFHTLSATTVSCTPAHTNPRLSPFSNLRSSRLKDVTTPPSGRRISRSWLRDVARSSRQSGRLLMGTRQRWRRCLRRGCYRRGPRRWSC